MIAYITTQGAKITREGTRLIVTSPDTRHILFSDVLEQLLLFGNITLTAPATFLLLKKNIDTVFFRMDGRYMGRLVQTESAHVLLRKKQFLLTDNLPFCLNVAKSIVEAKILNQATLLARIKRSRQKDVAGQGARTLRFFAKDALQAENIETLRGIEGAAAAVYFKHFSLGLTEDWGFTKRVRRPPTDPVNAVLSLLYTVLINRCYAAVRQVGLDPQPGVLHGLSYGRNALPLDLVEEFRAPLADALTFSLFNMRMLDWQDFHTPPPKKDPFEEIQKQEKNAHEACMQKVLNDPLGSMSEPASVESLSDLSGEQLPTLVRGVGRPVLLTSAALKKVLTALARKLETTFTHPVAEKHMSYNDAFVYQARMYRNFLEGSVDAYIPLMLR